LSDKICNIQCKEVAAIEKAFHRVQVDVIRIDKIVPFPSQGLHGGIRLGTQAPRLGSDDGMLTVGFIPNRMKPDSLRACGLHSRQLSPPLLAEAIPHSNRKARENFHTGKIA
jgi:hypothetical protein